MLPQSLRGVKSVYSLFVVRAEDDNRDKLLKYLKKNNIFAGIHYPVPIHLQKAYEELNLKKGSFPITEKFSEQVLSLPIFPELKKSEIKYIADLIKSFIRY